jgi:LytS/YehU family sensor histidine kinase
MKKYRHLLFCCAVLASLFLGMWLLHLAGFLFKDLSSAISDCFFFLFCIYCGRWLGLLYLKRQILVVLVVALFTVIGLSVIKWLLYVFIFGHLTAGYLELTRELMPFFLVGVVMGVLLKLVSYSIQKELKVEQLKVEQKTMAFNLLQSQLSPHFLFNVLNNLYGISITEHERIPPLLLKLSQLLRYSVYGHKKQYVALTEELEYINTYLDFEQIRISDRLVLETDIAAAIPPNGCIAPSVLIVFVENAFKHAKNSLDGKIFISLSLKVSGEFIHFEVRNSYSENEPVVLAESSGLGLSNTLKRLELLYGDDYELNASGENGFYTVAFKLKIKSADDDQMPYR